MNLEDQIEKAASLAMWLNLDKNKKRKIALIIACNKYKIPPYFRNNVSKRVTEIKNSKKPKQLMLIG